MHEYEYVYTNRHQRTNSVRIAYAHGQNEIETDRKGEKERIERSNVTRIGLGFLLLLLLFQKLIEGNCMHSLLQNITCFLFILNLHAFFFSCLMILKL